jgi:hypothetical protein
VALIDLFTPPTLDEIKAKIGQFAGLGKLAITLWYSGAPGEQLFQAFSRAAAVYVGSNGKFIRSFFLDYATDPGDPDPYDPANEALTPARGFLSELGEQCFFTERPGATFATTLITFHNSSNVAQVLYPEAVTVAVLGSPQITYVNDADPAFYTDPGGSRNLASGQTLDVQFTAQTPGASFNAAPGELSVLVTGWPSVAVSNAGAALGTDRMEVNAYRALCRTQAAATSPNGAPDAYLRLSRLNLDGTPLFNSLGAAVGITKVYISQSSTTGIVNVYYADGDGAADSNDVTAANANIMANVIAVPDTITITGLAAIETNITVTWAVKFRAKYLGAAIVSTDVKAAINAALIARFRGDYDIGGFDQTAGAGTIYASDIRGVVERAHPAIYSAVLSSPAGDTALALGHVARLTSPTGTETPG